MPVMNPLAGAISKIPGEQGAIKAAPDRLTAPVGQLLPQGALGTIPSSLQSLIELDASRRNIGLETNTAAQLDPQYALNNLAAQLNPRKQGLESASLDLTGEEIGARQAAAGVDRRVAEQLFGLETGDVNRGAEKEQLQLRGAMETSGNFGGGLYGQHKGFIEGQRASDVGKLGARHERDQAALNLTDKQLDIQARQLGIDRQTLDLKYEEAGKKLGIDRFGLDLLKQKAGEEMVNNRVGPYLSLLYQIATTAMTAPAQTAPAQGG